MSIHSGELSAELAVLPEILADPRRSAVGRATEALARVRARLLPRLRAGRRAATAPALGEAWAILALASPLALAGFVSMGISITDVVMMGWLGPTVLAAGAATSDLYSIFFYLGAGVLQAVAPLVAQARGARRPDEVSRVVRQGMWAALVVALPGAWAVWHAGSILAAIGVVPEIAAQGRPYARAMALTFVPMTGVMLFRQTLAACGRPRAFLGAMVAALPLNALGNWILMDGRFGMPRLGLAGIGLSSAAVATFLLLVLAFSLARDRELRAYRFFHGVPRPHGARLRELFRVGAPIGAGNLGEMGVFLFSTVIVGTLGVEVLAGHAVALRMSGVLYALPMALSQAATVRVALGVGAGDRAAVLRSARTAMALGVSVGMAFLVAVLWLRVPIAGAFLRDGGAPLEVAALLLAVVALMQPFEGAALTATGALRGLRDTRVPMLLLLGGHWGVGFATGLVLAFVLDLGGLGIWLGLAAGSTAVAVAMTVRLWRREKG
jgi:MATE family multidrug resistance protein